MRGETFAFISFMSRNISIRGDVISALRPERVHYFRSCPKLRTDVFISSWGLLTPFVLVRRFAGANDAMKRAVS